MEFQNPQYLVETDWLHAHLEDANLRALDCTVYLPNYFDASAAQKLEIVSGRAHWEQGHIPGSAFADLLQDLCGPADTRFRFPMPPAAQFAAAMSRYGVGEGTRVVLYDDMLNAWAARIWWMLRAFGFDNAAVLNGGWKKWTLEGRPISTAPRSIRQHSSWRGRTPSGLLQRTRSRRPLAVRRPVSSMRSIQRNMPAAVQCGMDDPVTFRPA